MITVIIPTLNSAADLPRCFESLISPVVRGVVREVVVSDGGSDDDTRALADATGAHFISVGKTRSAQLAAGARAARSDWLLFLNPETALEPGWDTEAEGFMARATPERPLAASFRRVREDFGRPSLRGEALTRLGALLFGLTSERHALLIPRRLYQRLDGQASHSDLARRIGRGHLVMLRSRGIDKVRLEQPERRSMTNAVLSALRGPRALPSRSG